MLPARALATPGARASAFTLRGAPGALWRGVFRMADHLGKRPVALSFFATWCRPCEIELPILDRERARLEPRGLVVAFVAIDGPETAAQIGALARRLSVRGPVLHDADSAVTSRYDPRRVVPFLVLVDRAGRIVREREGWTQEHARTLPGELEALVAA
jgi:thiol-disulfide isomerase/thioredoxin